MKKKISLLFLAFFSTLSSLQAQKTEFEPGYIVKDTDTIAGFLFRTNEIQLSNQVQFKKDSLSEAVTYNPGEIKGFGFSEDQLYFHTAELSLTKDNEQQKSFRFAKTLLKGHASLYRLELNDSELPKIFLNNNDFVYIIEKGDRFYTLGQYESLDEDNFYRLKKQYIGLLKSLTNDCATEIKESLAFNDAQILQIVEKYNSCIQPSNAPKVYSYKVKPIVRKGIEVSYGTIINFTDRKSIVNSHAPAVGYFWDIANPSRSRSTSFRTGLSYMYLSYAIPVLNSPKLRVTEHYLKVPLLAQWNIYTKNGVTPFFNLGLTAQLSGNTNLDYLDIVPFIDLATGVYINKIRLSLLLENYGLSLKSNKLLNFGIGYRIDKIKIRTN